MPSTNGHGPKRAILYARVSTDEQARSGYSLAQQIEALREHAICEGYEVFEEVQDPGQSGASLERPGMDRVRDLVAAGLSRAVVDAARGMVRDNRRTTNKGKRFFELGGMLYCGGCGKKMLYHASISKGRMYPYYNYKCRRVTRDGREACSSGRYRQNHRAETLEERIWESVSGLMGNPERLREDLERMIELEGRSSRKT